MITSCALVETSEPVPAVLDWMRPEFGAMGIEGCVAKLVESTYRPGRGGSWVKVRQMGVVDAVVVGVIGSAQRLGEVVVARHDEAGVLRQVGLSLPLPPLLSRRDHSSFPGVETSFAGDRYAAAGARHPCRGGHSGPDLPVPGG